MEQIINHSTMNQTRETLQDNFPTMIEYFLEDTGTYLQSIREGLDNHDLGKIHSPAHTIKSSSSQLGAERMSELAKEIEQIANDSMNGRDEELHKVNDLYNDLAHAFSDVEAELKNLIQSD